MTGAYVLEQLVDIGGAVWRASWQASVLAALVLAVQLMLGNRLPARWRHAMWMLVLRRLALPVVPSSPMSVFTPDSEWRIRDRTFGSTAISTALFLSAP